MLVEADLPGVRLNVQGHIEPSAELAIICGYSRMVPFVFALFNSYKHALISYHSYTNITGHILEAVASCLSIFENGIQRFQGFPVSGSLILADNYQTWVRRGQLNTRNQAVDPAPLQGLPRTTVLGYTSIRAGAVPYFKHNRRARAHQSRAPRERF